MATTAATPKKRTTILTPEATALFVYVWEPRPSINEGQPPQYQISLAFKKKQWETDPLCKKLRLAVKAATKAKFGDRPPSNLKDPFRYVDDMENPIDGYRGGVFITAKSKNKPGIVDKDLSPIEDPLDFYPGCVCRASVVPFAFDKKGTKGVTFLLNNLQKIKDGNRLDGRKRAEDEFTAIEDDDDEDPLD